MKIWCEEEEMEQHIIMNKYDMCKMCQKYGERLSGEFFIEIVGRFKVKSLKFDG